MKVLVTGARGQVGTEIILRGKSIGLQMLGLAHEDLDITCEEAVNAYIDNATPDIIINTAAYTAVDKAETEPGLTFSINRDGPSNLALTCAKHSIPLLHISTDYVFDGMKEGPYEEDDQPNPQGIYGKSKLAGEYLVKQQLDEHIILRVAWVFGASGHNFVRTMLRLGGERDALRVVADQQGSPTWAGDIATVLLSFVKRYEKRNDLNWGTYHYTGTPMTTWFGFAQTIFELAVKKGVLKQAPSVEAIRTKEYPTLAHRPANSVLKCNKIEQEFGISQADWRIGLNEVLKNWKRQ